MSEPSSHNTYCIALQPICDKALKHAADKLLYRSNSNVNFANIEDPLLATVRSCASAIYEVGIESLVGERWLLFTAPLPWIAQPDLLALPTEQLIAELPLELFMQPSGLTALHKLRQYGYALAVDAQAFQLCPELSPDEVDVIKIDTRQADAPQKAQAFQQRKSRLMATFIEDRTTLEQMRQLDFDWYQGFVFSPPVQVQDSGRKRSSNRAVELQIIAQLTSTNMDIDRLESLLAQHPHFCVLLLQQSNSAAFRRTARINTLREALVLLGSERIKAMATTLLLANNDPVRAIHIRPLLNRAAMAMNIAERVRSIDPQIAFTLGLFSRMDALEEITMDKLLNDVPFSTDIKNALLERQGEMGKLLNLLDAYESGDVAHLNSAVVTMLNDDFIRAARWTEKWILPN